MGLFLAGNAFIHSRILPIMTSMSSLDFCLTDQAFSRDVAGIDHYLEAIDKTNSIDKVIL